VVGFFGCLVSRSVVWLCFVGLWRLGLGCSFRVVGYGGCIGWCREFFGFVFVLFGC